MDIQDKTKEELIIELQELQQKYTSLKALQEKRAAELIIAKRERVFQNDKKEKRTPIYLLLIFVLFAIGIIIAGVQYYKGYK